MAASLRTTCRIIFSLNRSHFTSVHGNKSIAANFRALTTFQKAFLVEAKQFRSENNEKYHSSTHLGAALIAFAFVTKKADDGEKDKSKDEPSEKELLAKLAKEDPVVLLLKHAKLAERKHDFVAAEKYYHQSLDKLNTYVKEKVWDEDKVLQAKIFVYSNMAQLALRTYKFEEAEKLYKETLKGLLQMNVPKDDNAVVDVSLKLAMIYAIQKRDKEADEGYKFCMDTQERKISKMENVDDNTMALLGLCTDAYSRFLMVKKEYVRALESLEKALSIAKKVFGEIHPQVAVLYNDVATIASLAEDYDKAYDSAKKAVHIAESCDSHDLPTMLVNLGSVCIHKSLMNEARKYCKKSLSLSQKAKLGDTEKLARTCLDAIKGK